jgi:hypothetical protein
VLGIAAVGYDFAAGEASLRAFTVRRSEHPIWFCLLTVVNVGIAVGCVVLVIEDLYRRVSR